MAEIIINWLKTSETKLNTLVHSVNFRRGNRKKGGKGGEAPPSENRGGGLRVSFEPPLF